jgi:hypothetical protein
LSRKAVTITSVLLLLVLSAILAIQETYVYASDEYVYYGVVPGKLRFARPVRMLTAASIDLEAGWYLVAEASSAYVSIVGFDDGTNVKVYTLPDKTLVSEASLNAMENHWVQLANGTAFKVVSNKLVSVTVLGGFLPGYYRGGDKQFSPNLDEGTYIQGFYTSTDGSYIGKEFIFMASQAKAGVPYRVHALEDSEVTIYKDDGSTYTSFKLKANEFKDLSFKAFDVYKVTSTGHIMIQSDGPGGYADLAFTIPSAQGGFVGKVFYSISCREGEQTTWDPVADRGFRISAVEDTTVTVWDVASKRILQEVEVKEGIGLSIKPNADEVLIESSKPITLMSVGNGSYARSYEWSYIAGVQYIGVRPNEETPFFLPTNSSVEAYVFAYENTVAEIDDFKVTIRADEPFLITTPGNHKIIADKNVVIQILTWPLIPPIQGIASFGAVVPCVQKVNVSPDVTLTPIGAEGFPMTYVMAGAVAVVVAVVGFLVMKRRGK